MPESDGTPDALLRKVRDSRAELEAALRDITDEEMMRPGMTGRWDDVVVHWVRLTGIQHYGDHLKPILAWRRAHGKSDPSSC